MSIRRWLILSSLLLLTLAAAGWGGLKISQVARGPGGIVLPTTTVKRGSILVSVSGRGELQGGNSLMLSVPMTGGGDLAITYLRKPGELVREGDVVVKFDTTEQEFKLREAEADVAEAEAQVEQAKAESLAREEEARHALLQAETEFQLAELETRRNDLVAAIVARQNQLSLEAARDKLSQLKRDLANRKATTEAGVAIQEAALGKAKVQSETARRNIEALTLHAKRDGYVAVQQNQNSNFVFWGMQFPTFQTGDLARAGMAVAQIPDLSTWEIIARMGELDRGHLAVGQQARIKVIALPGSDFEGEVQNIGGTTGPPWDRRFECKVSIRNPSPELRPGMSATLEITTQELEDVLWMPSQALFESDGKYFVYLEQGGAFIRQDVTLVRRSESQVVIEGLTEGQVVSIASPDRVREQAPAGGALDALGKR